jgi:hypothetical protein
VRFEIDSRLSRIEFGAFSECSSLASICIPSSVEMLCKKCFYACTGLSIVRFEIGSKLSCIEMGAFSECSSLSSICVPPGIENVIYESLGPLRKCDIVVYDS